MAERRQVGDTTEAVVRAEFEPRDSPMLPETQAVWAAMTGRGIGRLVLAILAKEQRGPLHTEVGGRHALALSYRRGPGG